MGGHVRQIGGNPVAELGFLVGLNAETAYDHLSDTLEDVVIL